MSVETAERYASLIAAQLESSGRQLKPGVRVWELGWCRCALDYSGDEVVCRVDLPMDAHEAATRVAGSCKTAPSERKQRVVDALVGFANRNFNCRYVDT